jgi:hypothetical protein
MPDRRTFLITCGGMVAVPALAHFGLPLTGSSLPASVAAAPPKLVLRIDGWESPADSESDVWVQVSSSWRATWR